ILADLEMEMRRGRPAGGAAQRDDLMAFDEVAGLHEDTGRVPIHRFVAAPVVHEHVETVDLILARGTDHPATRRTDVRIVRHGDVETGVVPGAGRELARDETRLRERPRIRLVARLCGTFSIPALLAERRKERLSPL